MVEFKGAEVGRGEEEGSGLEVQKRETVEVWLKRAAHLAPVSIREASYVKAFYGKWTSITHRLLQLPGLLADLEDPRWFSDSTACKHLLQRIVASLEEARVLAKKCTDLSYGGKLHTQSNLDSLAGKLDLHIHDCRSILKSGVLRENPLAICRVTPESAREALRWTARDLLARLQVGNADCKSEALDSLIRFMSEDDKHVLVVSTQGGISSLVPLLSASQSVVKEKAGIAVCKLASMDCCQHAVVTEGALPPLVRLLASGSSAAQEKAAAALQGLTFAAERARAVAAHGGIPALVATCRSGTPTAQAVAVGSLRNIAGAVAELRSSIAEEYGAIAVIISLVASGTKAAQENAAATLQNLAVSDNSLRQVIAREGGIPPLLRFLDNATGPRTQEIAMGALRNLAACSSNTSALVGAGFLPRLLQVLRDGLVTAQQVAAAAVCHMATTTETRKLLGDAGVIPPLVKMLVAKTCTAQEYSAQALASLLLVDGNRKQIMADDKGIPRLVALLDTRTPGVAKQFPIAALQTLVSNGRCRKQMVALGACYHLRVLADMDITGAKRLQERLESGKLRSILSRPTSFLMGGAD